MRAASRHDALETVSMIAEKRRRLS